MVRAVSWTWRLALGLALLAHAATAAADDPSRLALDSEWEARMLAERYGSVLEGRERPPLKDVPYRTAAGLAAGAAYTSQGVVVRDFSETRRVLWSGGGWALHGGLLARAMADGTTIDLYGKRTMRREPSFVFDFRMRSMHNPPERPIAWEYFLVVRPAAPGVPTIVKRWAVPVEAVGGYGERDFVLEPKALLEYDPVAAVATMRITGLKQALDERVPMRPAQSR